MKKKLEIGFTLVEVMISVVIFSIVAVGVASATLLTSKISYSNIYRNTAYTSAQGYAEQIKSIRYGLIEVALNEPTEHKIPTRLLSIETGKVEEIEDPLVFGQRYEKNVVVDIEKHADGSEHKRIMRMWITPTGRDLSVGADEVSAIEVSLDFEWEVSERSLQKVFKENIKIVKTAISEY